MRAILIFSFTLINWAAYSQIFGRSDPKIKGKVDFIMERSDGYKNNWREYSFDSLSRIVEIKYYRDNELLENHFLSYKMINDSVMIITETNKSKRGVSVHNSKYYYDSQKRIVRYENFKENSLIPMIVELNAKYENGKLKQYDRILIPKDTSVIENYRLDYLYNKIIIKKTDNKKISEETTVIKLDKKGNWIDMVVDYNDPECVLGGIRPYSQFHRDKYEIKYKYDKTGNWIQSYSVTQFWRYKKDKREIKYN